MAALGLAAGQATAAPVPAGGPGGRVPRNAISVQLYTLRSLLEQDVPGTLAELSAIGYQKVELAGTYGRTAAEFRALLDRFGLRATSSHNGVEGDFDQVVADALTLGQTYVAAPWAMFDTAEEWRSYARQLDEAGAKARRAGLRFGYHNHGHEFQLVDGERPIDIILEHTQRQNVYLEVDLYWVVDGGVDPVDFVHSTGGRVRQYHVKDRSASGEWADLGTGTIDFGRIFRETRTAGVREFVVEHDNPSDPLTTVRVGYEYLRDLRF
ncbi:sugar phosphate isomerase [Actinoalloteichus sp. AHMU CJ021]|nr:sugar phosphate isomerase [Actinoalloteichus sp. AHMU CJ021]